MSVPFWDWVQLPAALASARSLVGSLVFWYGLGLLLYFQYSKFAELSTKHDDPDDPLVISDLRAVDFVSRRTYESARVAYLASSALLYFGLCLIPPEIWSGFQQALYDVAAPDPSGLDATPAPPAVEPRPEPADAARPIVFPLVLVSLYMGLAQTTFPGFPGISTFQRDIFHWFIGIPKRVLNASDAFHNQALARIGGDEQKTRALIRSLADPVWIERIDRYADARFYKRQLKRLKIADPHGASTHAALAQPMVELSALIEKLIFAAALATARESGVRALPQLKDDLHAQLPPLPAPAPAPAPAPGPALPSPAPERVRLATDAPRAVVLLPGMAVAVAATVVLWLLLPPLGRLVGAAGLDLLFVPRTLTASGSYILGQVAPMLLAVVLVLYRRPLTAFRNGTALGVNAIKPRSDLPLLLAVLVLVVAWDYGQTLSDMGYSLRWAFGSSLSNTAKVEPPRLQASLAYLLSFLPFHLLHAVIVCMACRFVLGLGRTMAAGGPRPEGLGVRLGAQVAAVGLCAALLAILRLVAQFGVQVAEPFLATDELGVCLLDPLPLQCRTLSQAWDFVILVAGLNLAALTFGFVASVRTWRHPSITVAMPPVATPQGNAV